MPACTCRGEVQHLRVEAYSSGCLENRRFIPWYTLQILVEALQDLTSPPCNLSWGIVPLSAQQLPDLPQEKDTSLEE